MNYSEALDYIASFKTVSLSPSLERITALLNALNNPEKDLKAIHIAGTNGKGSVASMTASILKSTGKKVGLYISPYVICFRERIQINGEMISEADLVRLCGIVKNAFDSIEPEGFSVSQFEFTTALAFLYFKEQNCDYVVLETGLGGRYDATNVIEKPVCTVITHIALDHTKVLGSTLKEIAWEKAGIIKESIPVITTNTDSEVLKVLNSECDLRHTHLIQIQTNQAQNVEITSSKTSFEYKGESFETSLLGVHQVENALLSISACKVAEMSITNEIINKGLKNIVHPGRLELIRTKPPLILDGAHNPDAAQVLKSYLLSIKFSGKIIFSAVKDKNYGEVLKILSSVSEDIILVEIEGSPRAESIENMKSAAKGHYKNINLAKDFKEALFLVKNSPAIVCGSLFLVSEIRTFIKGE